MTTKQESDPRPPSLATPNPAMQRLARLVGIWDIRGRTPDAAEDNILGRMTCEWMAGGFFLAQRGKIHFGGATIESLEIIAYDPAHDNFPAHVYTNMSGTVLGYCWDVRGDTLTHWTAGNKYTARSAATEKSFPAAGGRRRASKEWPTTQL